MGYTTILSHLMGVATLVKLMSSFQSMKPGLRKAKVLSQGDRARTFPPWASVYPSLTIAVTASADTAHIYLIQF